MSRTVLVLNKGGVAIGVIPVQRAIGLASTNYRNGEPKARVMDTLNDFALYSWADWSEMRAGENEAVVRSAHRSHRVPEIILLSRYNKMPQHCLRFNRRTIYRRDNNQCQFCGCKPGTALLNIDHIIPRVQGGESTWTNCCISCLACNTRKAGRTPEQAGMKFFNPNYKPVKPKFTLDLGSHQCKSWSAFISTCYWEVELQNDNR